MIDQAFKMAFSSVSALFLQILVVVSLIHDSLAGRKLNELVEGRNVIDVALDQNSNGNDITEVGFTVYSSKVGIWNIANAKVQIFRRSFGHIFPRTLSRSVFTGRKLHWKLDKDVLWFDIEEDIAGVVAVPGEEDKFSDGEIGGYNGELSFTNMSDSNIEIWVLRSNQKTEFMWLKKYNIA
ncbi:hypothetical protein FRX31_023660 [Thalictrum thalictroides]|uniref:Uncharacterized protein n=1 Tax=Thalictrum thalictroides TaxID=46969 RepID=A0A7J6VPC6_THATH|nr:hypothetical protein FRX31_023660 [Thalictrum thalictroides]